MRSIADEFQEQLWHTQQQQLEARIKHIIAPDECLGHGDDGALPQSRTSCKHIADRLAGKTMLGKTIEHVCACCTTKTDPVPLVHSRLCRMLQTQHATNARAAHLHALLQAALTSTLSHTHTHTHAVTLRHPWRSH